MGRENREISPVILKIGFALAFSISGMLFALLRNKSIKSANSSTDRPKSSDCNNHGNSGRIIKSEHLASRETPNSCGFNHLATDKNNSLSDKDPYLLPEFNDLVKEFDLTSIKTTPDSDVPISDSNSPKVNSMVNTDSHDQEINSLKNMVVTLKERERNLELQLLEYYGLKEQQTAVMELQNRLKLNKMETKLLSLKVNSLENENKRLESQMADYNKVLTDLEAARAEVKVLKKKLRSEAAQNKERIMDLRQRVEKMQEDEHKRGLGVDLEIELKLCKLKDLEDEVNELRKSNYDLQVEKSELTQRLEQVQILATSVLEDEETEKLRKESEHLKKQNEELTTEIEQLQAARCSDIEELVYMRWINACLRYELRNYQPEPGKTMARDLSKTLSPRSEQKAKKLILEYANQELDPDQWSSPPYSSELDESHKSSSKFLGKLVKFLRRKDGNSLDHSEEEMSSYRSYSFGYLPSSSKHSMDLQRHKRIDSFDDGFSGSVYSLDGQKSELVKYAEVLQDSNPQPLTRYRRRRSAQFSSF